LPLNIEKAKEKARKLELKGQIDKAISQYARVLDELEGSPELTDELALYNKLGDLYLKRGDVASAVEQYETAVTHYAEQGFPNNAIALCNKVLRNAPGRTHVYLKLAKLMMQRGFVAEAKQNLLEYAERMQKAGQIEDAFHALKEFADLSPDNEEIRLLLAEQLKNAARTDEAREQLAKLYHEVQESGDARRARKTLERMKAIDPEYDIEGAPTPTLKSRKQKSSDIVFIDLDEDRGARSGTTVAEEDVAEIGEPFVVEPTSLGEGPDVTEAVIAGELADVQRAVDEIDIDADAASVTQLEDLEVGESFDMNGVADIGAVEIEPTTLDEPLVEEDESADDGIQLIDVSPDVDVDEEEIAELEDLVVDGEGLPEALMGGPESASAESVSEVLDLEDVEDQLGETDAELFRDEPLEAGVEVPELDVEGFDGVPELTLEEDEEDVGPLADLPILDTGAETLGMAEDEVAEESTATAVDDGSYESEDTVGGSTADLVEEPQSGEIEFLTEYEPDEIEAESEEDVAVDDSELREPEPTEQPETATQTLAQDIADIEARVLDDPGAPEPHRELGEALIEAGERERGMEELEIALTSFEGLSDWRHALSVTEEILRLEPNSVHHHQKRVEYSYRMDDRQSLAAAYLELADALVRSGAVDRAQVVYRRVLEHDPASNRARVALETLQSDEVVTVDDITDAVGRAEHSTAVGVDAVDTDGITEVTVAAEQEGSESLAAESTEPAAAEGAGFIDLGALVMEEEQARDTRMRIQQGEPTGDEERDFEIMLSEFKKGIEANIELGDTQAHYDLGVAFKEMGLLDEAISEFQKALRGAQGRLRTAEALGLCFYEKKQFAVAGTVLRRAVDLEPGGDDEKIGLLYWLGRCEEEQSRNSQALSYYQRIFSIDIGFQDVRERVKSLAQQAGS
jgi:tetratricopeptide (TPR) repeat protein